MTRRRPLLIVRQALKNRTCLKNGAFSMDGGLFQKTVVIMFLKRGTRTIYFWEDCDTLEICSLWKFRDLWNYHLPHVLIRSPCYGTYGKCAIFKNAFRYHAEKNKKQLANHPEDSDDDDVCSDDNESLELDDFQSEERVTSNIADSFLSCNCAEEQAIIQAAWFHVDQANVMRKLVQKCAQEAKYNTENGVLHPNKRYCLMCDYGQNLGIPYFGK
jgi:hypothetical protein